MVRVDLIVQSLQEYCRVPGAFSLQNRAPAILFDELDSVIALALEKLPVSEPRTVADSALFFLGRALFSDNTSCFGVLGLEPTADAETIKRRYRALVKLVHPDMAQSRNLPHDAAVLLNKAYAVLTGSEMTWDGQWQAASKRPVDRQRFPSRQAEPATHLGSTAKIERSVVLQWMPQSAFLARWVVPLQAILLAKYPLVKLASVVGFAVFAVFLYAALGEHEKMEIVGSAVTSEGAPAIPNGRARLPDSAGQLASNAPDTAKTPLTEAPVNAGIAAATGAQIQAPLPTAAPVVFGATAEQSSARSESLGMASAGQTAPARQTIPHPSNSGGLMATPEQLASPVAQRQSTTAAVSEQHKGLASQATVARGAALGQSGLALTASPSLKTQEPVLGAKASTTVGSSSKGLGTGSDKAVAGAGVPVRMENLAQSTQVSRVQPPRPATHVLPPPVWVPQPQANASTGGLSSAPAALTERLETRTPSGADRAQVASPSMSANVAKSTNPEDAEVVKAIPVSLVPSKVQNSPAGVSGPSSELAHVALLNLISALETNQLESELRRNGLLQSSNALRVTMANSPNGASDARVRDYQFLPVRTVGNESFVEGRLVLDHPGSATKLSYSIRAKFAPFKDRAIMTDFQLFALP